MASQHRSVWEIRWSALLQTMRNRRMGLKNMVAQKALSQEGLCSQDKECFKQQIELLNELLKLGDKLGKTHISRIWLACDY